MKSIVILGYDSQLMEDLAIDIHLNNHLKEKPPYTIKFWLETKRHPRDQQEVIDDLIAKGNHFIVTTHSSTILARIQRRIADKIINHQEIEFIMVHNKDFVETLKHNEIGLIINSPPRFFSEDMQDLKAVLDRKKYS